MSDSGSRELLTVSDRIWRLFPGLRIVVVGATGVDADGAAWGAAAALREAARELEAGWEHANIQSHPRVAAWREALRALGLSPKKFPSSIESLGRRALKGRLGSIHPLVDFYNAVSLRQLVPAGGWDVGRLGAPLRLALTAGGERFEPLGGGEAEEVGPGEVAYLAGDEVVTRHFVWRQAESGKLTIGSRRVVLVSELLQQVPRGVEQAVLEAMSTGLASLFGAEVTGTLLEG